MADKIKDILCNLTENQRKAVTCKEKAVLVTGPAGNGKTEVLKKSLQYHLSTHNIKPEEILCFTEHEEDMRESLHPFMGNGYAELWLNNFTAFSKKILRKHYGKLKGIYPNFRVIEGLEEKLVLKKVITGLELKYYKNAKTTEGFINEIVDFMDLLKLNNCEVFPTGGSLKYSDLALIYNGYNEYLKNRNFMDFRDLVLKALQLFSDYPDILQLYRDRFKLFILDDYQNIDINQYRLFSMLAEGGLRVMVSGNGDEGVFRFRGAMPDKVSSEFIDKFKPVRIELSDAVKQTPEKIIVKCSGPNEEALFIARQVYKLTRQGYHYDDIAILCRGISSDVRNVEEALNIYNIPYSVTGGIAFFKQPEIIQIIAILKLLRGEKESVNDYITRVLYAPGLRIAPPEVERIISFSERNRLPLVEAVKSPLDDGLKKRIKEETVKSVEMLGAILEELRQSSKILPLEKLIYRVFLEFGYIREGSENGKLANNLDYFIKIVESFRRIEGRSSFAGFMNYIDDILSSYGRDESVYFDPGEDTVRIMTVQHSRGRFFPVVFVAGLVDGKFPRQLPVSSLLSEEEKKKMKLEPLTDIVSHMSEEKRIFNLACSRASKKLYLSFAEGGEGAEELRRSGYVDELIGSGGGYEFLDMPSVLGVVENGDMLTVDDVADAWVRTGNAGLESVLKKNYEDKYEALKRLKARYSAGDLCDRVKIPSGFRFSASKLEQYGKCPAGFFFSSFVHIWFPQKPQMVFGSMIHGLLAGFHEKYNKKELLEDGKAGEYLKKEIEREFSDMGVFDTVFEKEVYRNLAERVLLRYLAVSIAGKEGFNVEACEKKFRWINKDAVFSGRIDRLDKLDNGTYEVIDYKTGKSAAMGFKLCRQMRDGENFQLPIYYFAAKESLKKNVGKLSIYWLRKDMEKDKARIKAEVEIGEKYTFKEDIYSDAALEKARERIEETVKSILEGNYPQGVEKTWECRRCDFKLLCDEKNEENEEDN